MGAAANESLVFAGTEKKAQTITMVALAGIGTARTFINGSGILEVTSKSWIRYPSYYSFEVKRGEIVS